jgi:hypothetical protein
MRRTVEVDAMYAISGAHGFLLDNPPSAFFAPSAAFLAMCVAALVPSWALFAIAAASESGLTDERFAGTFNFPSAHCTSASVVNAGASGFGVNSLSGESRPAPEGNVPRG